MERDITAWIELHQAVWTHRKALALAEALDLEDTVAAAYVIRLWTWALDSAPDGALAGLTDRAIASAAGWRGDAERFVGALSAAGWLDGARGSYAIHDWSQYAGRYAERRKVDAERLKRWRAERRAERLAAAGSETPMKRVSPPTRNAFHETPVKRGETALPDPTGPDRTGIAMTTDSPTPTLLPGATDAAAEPVRPFLDYLESEGSYRPSPAVTRRIAAELADYATLPVARALVAWYADRQKVISHNGVVDWLLNERDHKPPPARPRQVSPAPSVNGVSAPSAAVSARWAAIESALES